MMDEFDMIDVDCEEEVQKPVEDFKFNPEYTRNRNHSYLWINGTSNQDVEQMLVHNKIKGLLPVTINNEDGDTRYRYEITSLIPLIHWIKKKSVGIEEIRIVLNSIYHCSEALEEFFLELESLVLIPEYIFIDEKDLQCYFIFFDEYRVDFTVALKQVLQFFLENISDNKRKETRCVYDIYETLQNPNYCLEEVMEKLYDKKEESIDEMFEPQEIEYEEILEEKKNPISKILSRIFYKRKKEIPLLEEEEEYEDPETTILKVESKTKILKSINPEINDIPINAQEVIIGKVASVTTVQIDSKVISRMHAKIYKKQGEWKIVDLLSTNGTHLNGKRLKAEEEYTLKEGDKVKFADLEYVFY